MRKLTKLFRVKEARLPPDQLRPFMQDIQSWINGIRDREWRTEMHELYGRFLQSEPGNDESQDLGRDLARGVYGEDIETQRRVTRAITKLMMDKMG